MADNYINVRGLRVKNQGLVHQITLRLRTLHSQLRKVKGHNNDQWKDRADALADMGRDAAMDWSECSFDIVSPDGRIGFRKSKMDPDWGLSELCKQLATEKYVKILNWQKLRVYKPGIS
jgi:hypothetical protein